MKKMRKLAVAMIAALTLTAGFASTTTVFASGYNQNGTYVRDYSSMMVKVKSGYLALRKAPEYAETNEIGALKTGDIVKVHEYHGGNYAVVEVPKLGGRIGYVNVNYLVNLK